MISEVLALRHASRELVRELRFLQDGDAAPSVSHCHALIEIEARTTAPQAELPALLRLDKSTTSRLVSDLVTRGWLRARASKSDARARDLTLTAAGRAQVKVVHREANARVEQALVRLRDEERTVVLRGIALYARALERSRRASLYTIRPIRAGDCAAVGRLIRSVMPEFGAQGPGFAILDPEVDDMFGAYRGPRAAYFVVTRSGAREGEEVVVGGCGFAQLVGGTPSTCELRKMYFLSEVRGLGVGAALLAQCLARARKAGFEQMYLETLAAMSQARALYERSGFRRLERSMGATGHFGCNSFYILDLRT